MPTRTSQTRWSECATAWRHANMRSCVNTASLSEYEQPLPIRERDGGSVVPATRRHARHGHGGASASGSGDALTRGYAWIWRRYHNTNNRYQTANVTLARDADMNVTGATSRVRGEWRHGNAPAWANKKATLLKVTRFARMCTFLQKSLSRNLLSVYHKFIWVSISDFRKFSP